MESVYFLAGPDRIKVGYSSDMKRRVSQLRAVDMDELRVIGTISGSRALERVILRRLRPYRLRGEWYRDCDEVRAVMAAALAGEFNEAAATLAKARDKERARSAEAARLLYFVSEMSALFEAFRAMPLKYPDLLGTHAARALRGMGGA